MCINGCEIGFYSDCCKRGIVLVLKLIYVNMLFLCILVIIKLLIVLVVL